MARLGEGATIDRSTGARCARRQFFAAVVLATAVGLTACGGGGGPDGPAPGPAPAPAPSPAVGAYLASLPSWQSFAPDKIDKAEEGKELEDTSVPPTVEDLLQGTKTLSCTTRKVDFYKTPAEYAMFSPPLDVLYPGALVQGGSLRDGAGPSDILPLTITERNNVTVSIPACLTNDNSRTVPPTLDAVNQARSSIVASAIAQGLNCVSAIGSLRTETYRNDTHKALSIGVSGRYYGFSASADTSINKSKTENGLSVTFTEQLYKVQYQAPQTPAEVFSPAFTDARLQQQVALNRIGPDNLPVYVAEVTYGRLMNFTMVSSASETDMEVAVKVAYGFAGVPGSVAGKVDSTQKEILQKARYSVAYLGGSTQANASMLQNLNWGDYFSVPVTAADAVPISFTLRNLSDNSIAVVQELTSYDLTTCVEKLADDATFGFKDEQTFTPGFSVPGLQLVAMGDLDGRNGKDIVWATTGSGGRGEFRVALSNGDGTFGTVMSGMFPSQVLQTGEFSLALADVDADGRADIILNARDNAVGNRVYVAFYKDAAGPGFVYSAVQDMGGPGAWVNYALRTGQMDGVRGADLVWNNVPISTSVNSTYIAHAVDTKAPGFDLTTAPLFVRAGSLNHFANNFSGYEYTHIGDFDGDGRDDIMWETLDANGNSYYLARGTPTGLDFGGTSANTRNHRNFGSSWAVYTALAGDVTGGGKADLVLPRTRSPFDNNNPADSADFGIYFTPGSSLATTAYTGALAFKFRDPVKDAAIAPLLGQPNAVVPEMHLGDVDGDGRMDLIINDRARSSLLTNKVGIGLGTSTGQFSFARVAQDVGPARDWSNYATLVADVNGDGREDIVWISQGTTTSVYVGLARGN